MTTVLIAATLVIALFGVGFGVWTLRHTHGELKPKSKGGDDLLR